MSENNEKARHGFVSFWLWANILGNSFLTVQQFATRNDSSDLNSKGIMFSIAVIVGNILILKWKIIGVFVIYAVAVLVAVITAPFLFYFGYGLITPIGLALIISIHAAIFNIKENGISVWEHLKNEAKANKREARIWVARVFGTIILLFVIAAFPIKIFYGNIIVLFAPQRIVPYYGYSGKVLGNHVLKTEYGEIRIGHLSFVSINGIGDMGIKSELFENGQVSHNLVFLGTELPEHLYVRFNRSQITEFDLNRDISIYGIPITGNIFFFDPPNNTVLFYGSVYFLQKHITLADSTELNVAHVYLSVYKDEQRWVLELPWRNSSSISVKRPGETEFTAYRSITLKENWGEFIEGELLEE